VRTLRPRAAVVHCAHAAAAAAAAGTDLPLHTLTAVEWVAARGPGGARAREDGVLGVVATALRELLPALALCAGAPTPPDTYYALAATGPTFTAPPASLHAAAPNVLAPRWFVVRLPHGMAPDLLLEELRRRFPDAVVHGPDSAVLLATADDRGGAAAAAGASVDVSATTELAGTFTQPLGDLAWVGAGSAATGAPDMALLTLPSGGRVASLRRPVSTFEHDHIHVFPALASSTTEAGVVEVQGWMVREATIALPLARPDVPLPSARASPPAARVPHAVTIAGPSVLTEKFNIGRHNPDVLISDESRAATVRFVLQLATAAATPLWYARALPATSVEYVPQGLVEACATWAEHTSARLAAVLAWAHAVNLAGNEVAYPAAMEPPPATATRALLSPTVTFHDGAAIGSERASGAATATAAAAAVRAALVASPSFRVGAGGGGGGGGGRDSARDRRGGWLDGVAEDDGGGGGGGGGGDDDDDDDGGTEVTAVQSGDEPMSAPRVRLESTGTAGSGVRAAPKLLRQPTMKLLAAGEVFAPPTSHSSEGGGGPASGDDRGAFALSSAGTGIAEATAGTSGGSSSGGGGGGNPLPMPAFAPPGAPVAPAMAATGGRNASNGSGDGHAAPVAVEATSAVASMLRPRGATLEAAGLLSPHLARALGGGGAAAGGSGGRQREVADPFRSSRRSLVHAKMKDYKPKLDFTALASRRDVVLPFDPASVTRWPEVGDTPSRDYLLHLPLTAGPTLVSRTLAAQVLYAAATEAASPMFTFPCGLHTARQLLHDYAELKVTWCEKVVTEKRREWLREEAALEAAGEDTSEREMPDFAGMASRQPASPILRLESATATVIDLATAVQAAHEALEANYMGTYVLEDASNSIFLSFESLAHL